MCTTTARRETLAVAKDAAAAAAREAALGVRDAVTSALPGMITKVLSDAAKAAAAAGGDDDGR